MTEDELKYLRESFINSDKDTVYKYSGDIGSLDDGGWTWMLDNLILDQLKKLSKGMAWYGNDMATENGKSVEWAGHDFFMRRQKEILERIAKLTA